MSKWTSYDARKYGLRECVEITRDSARVQIVIDGAALWVGIGMVHDSRAAAFVADRRRRALRNAQLKLSRERRKGVLACQ